MPFNIPTSSRVFTTDYHVTRILSLLYTLSHHHFFLMLQSIALDTEEHIIHLDYGSSVQIHRAEEEE